jgi:hypothetical protein
MQARQLRYYPKGSRDGAARVYRWGPQYLASFMRPVAAAISSVRAPHGLATLRPNPTGLRPWFFHVR